jgi:hypothetical protein
LSINYGKIKILLYGEKYHAKAFCKQLENYEKGIFEPKYFDELTPGLSYDEFDLFHLISSPLPVIKKLNKYKKPILYHWIGTDVYRLIKDSLLKRTFKKFVIQSSYVKNLVVSENLKNELNHHNISSTILPLTKLKFIDEIPLFPDKFSVLAYVPEDRWDFYNGDLILELAEKLPQTEFHILASGNRKSNLPNVFFYDFVEDVTPFYKRCSVLVRVTVHDGLPKMVLEALAYGRHVLWNGSLPYCFKVNSIDECVMVLNKLKGETKANEKGKIFAEQNFNPGKILDEYLSLCLKLIGDK